MPKRTTTPNQEIAMQVLTEVIAAAETADAASDLVGHLKTLHSAAPLPGFYTRCLGRIAKAPSPERVFRFLDDMIEDHFPAPKPLVETVPTSEGDDPPAF